jgi:hypothetical protein
VPYHPGSPRYYDLSAFNFVLTGVATVDCPTSVGGAPISAHVCKGGARSQTDVEGLRRGAARRGIDTVGAINAANYRYIQEYTFRDDGIIIGRMGATGQNLPGDELVAHAHNAIRRIDIDLDGVVNNTARLQHIENPANAAGTASDITAQIALAQGFTWSARAHDAVEVCNPSFKNAPGHLATYHLVPLVTGGGLTQHYEKFTQNDFWVTPYSRDGPYRATGTPKSLDHKFITEDLPAGLIPMSDAERVAILGETQRGSWPSSRCKFEHTSVGRD